jgi:hypothetical protein
MSLGQAIQSWKGEADDASSRWRTADEHANQERSQKAEDAANVDLRRTRS